MSNVRELPRWLLPKHRPRPIIALSIAKDVAYDGRHYSALSEMPWLRVEFNGPIPAGQWIRLTFLASLLDPLCRPLLRCITANGHYDSILPGALFGRSIWLGRLQDDTQEVWISPTNRLGPFRFSIERIDVVHRARLLAECFRRHPVRCCIALAARLAGLRFLADLQIRRVLSATSLLDYAAWRQERMRPIDETGFEAPRFDWKIGPCIIFVLPVEQDFRPIIQNLKTQPYPNWRVVIAGALNRNVRALAADPRIVLVDADRAVGDISELPADSLLIPLSSCSEIPAYALMTLVEATRNGVADIFYGDEDCVDTLGRHLGVKLKPDWSPRFQYMHPYLGSAVFFRMRALRDLPVPPTLMEFLRSSDKIQKNLIDQNCGVQHVRRILLTTHASTNIMPPAQPHSGERPASANAAARASIILPTRDRRYLLEPCIKSLQSNLLNEDMEVIVADNGSTDRDVIQFLANLSTDRRFRVLSFPGTFNFSALCNQAAEVASTETLIFLNNDTEALAETRIEPLISLAQKSDVGAVGAKLIYPNGRVQHAGIVLGTDGYAGHIERGIERDHPGYFGRFHGMHEISAVTAACLAVEKHKFFAVKGFDSAHLPIELNDIDLCLRLAERGWKTICACECVLIHRESKSRGATWHVDSCYHAERDHIQARWANRLRDDPYFHPALSLDSLSVKLG
jgi:O-antigen biosynthesis protein